MSKPVLMGAIAKWFVGGLPAAAKRNDRAAVESIGLATTIKYLKVTFYFQ